MNKLTNIHFTLYISSMKMFTLFCNYKKIYVNKLKVFIYPISQIQKIMWYVRREEGVRRTLLCGGVRRGNCEVVGGWSKGICCYQYRRRFIFTC